MLFAQLMAPASTMWNLSSLPAQLRGASTRGKWLTSPQVQPLHPGIPLHAMTSPFPCTHETSCPLMGSARMQAHRCLKELMQSCKWKTQRI